jgi:hypothetical protein
MHFVTFLVQVFWTVAASVQPSLRISKEPVPLVLIPACGLNSFAIDGDPSLLRFVVRVAV